MRKNGLRGGIPAEVHLVRHFNRGVVVKIPGCWDFFGRGFFENKRKNILKFMHVANTFMR